MQRLVYQLKLKQEHYGVRTEMDIVFKSLRRLQKYLETLWNIWEESVSPDDLERLPPVPSLLELEAGLNAGRNSLTNYPSFECVSLGFLDQDETLSVVLIVTEMIVY